MMTKSWTYEARKWSRLKRDRCFDRPRRFRLRRSLKEVGAIARLLRLHGLAVSKPQRMSATEWMVIATVPDHYSRARLLRLCNYIDRTASLGILVSLNVRVFRWLGKDRRKPWHFYRSGKAFG